MISTPLVICLAVASTAIVIVLMMWRNRFPTIRKEASWPSRDATFASMLLSLAAAVGLARAEAERSGDGNADGGHGWHGSHLDHGTGAGFSDGGGFSGGDAGGGGI
jgi:uncharacterized membrane protein YgcG